MSVKRAKKLWAVGVGGPGDKNGYVEIHRGVQAPKVRLAADPWGELPVYYIRKPEIVTLCSGGLFKATGIRVMPGETAELYVRVVKNGK
jgi:hypothetical protein